MKSSFAAADKLPIASALGLALVLSAGDAHAQARRGFAIDRFEPAERGSPSFVVDALDLRSASPTAPRPAIGAVFDYGYKPLVVYDAVGEERAALVRHQLFAHLGASFVFVDRFRLAVSLPLALYQDGEDVAIEGILHHSANAPAIGDLRFAMDARITGRFGDPFTLAAGVRAWVPTGVPSQFTSDGTVRVAPQLLAAGTVGVLVWGARLALVARPRDDVYAGRQLGSELFGAASAGVALAGGRVRIAPEVWLSSGFTGGASFFGKHGTAIGWLLGAHVTTASGMRVGGGIGSGIGPGLGAPLVNAVASIEWGAPIVPPPRAPAPDEDPEWSVDPAVVKPSPRPADRPLAVVTDSEIEIGESVAFVTDSADLAGDSDAVLGAVATALREHPEIKKVRVEGHTDATGDPGYNEQLSSRRAAAVTQWLVAHGIDPARLESVGFGSRRPIASNDTEEGRARNRRVVFGIAERSSP